MYESVFEPQKSLTLEKKSKKNIMTMKVPDFIKASLEVYNKDTDSGIHYQIQQKHQEQ